MHTPPAFAQLLQPPSAPGQAHLLPLVPSQLNAVVAVEQMAHSHPWSHRQFSDCLDAAYLALGLWGSDELLGHLIAMPGFMEAHLLNITVAPEHQGQGWARLLLDALTLWARGLPAENLWLEVRVGNARARQVYERHGFMAVGLRKNYYPASRHGREDAIVMRRDLDSTGASA